MKLIQTSTTLNPGNSGGPVFDIYGKVVGIVTMKLGNSFDGISFVIPSEGAMPILYDMMEGIEITNEKRYAVATTAAKLGIMCEAFVENGVRGVKIIDFSSPTSDCSKKLRIGDIIISAGGTSVKNAYELGEILKNYDPGQSLELTVYRSEQALTFVIILEG